MKGLRLLGLLCVTTSTPTAPLAPAALETLALEPATVEGQSPAPSAA